MGTMGRTTIKDIALAADVSITTVSHALNHTRHVSPVTRARVQDLAQKMGYRPNSIARTLQGQDSLLIGHILSQLHTNLFYALVARGADQRAQELGYATIMAHTESHVESEEQAVRLLLDKRVNGIIFTTPLSPSNVLLAMSEGACAVMIERPLPVPGAHAVVIDHRRGIYDLTCMLVEQGHHHIAYVGGDFSLPGSDLVERERLRGFQDAMIEVGLSVPLAQMLLVPYGINPARSACQALLDGPRRPTALVIGSDLLAAGVLQVLYERRLRVPDDLSVVSFDDTLGPYMAPALTESKPPDEEMGRQAVELIVRYSQRQADRSQRIVLQPQLHRRDSTRTLNHADASPQLSERSDSRVDTKEPGLDPT